VARLVFIRHAHSTANDAGILSGQLPGVTLSKKGKKQAQLLVDRLGPSEFHSVRVSPMQRCEETISPWLLSSHSKGIKNYFIDNSLIEVDYGQWSGRKLSSLSKEKLWKASVHDALKQSKNGTHLFVSHGDVLKAIVASLLKIKLDDFQSLVIDPASITIVDFDGDKSRLIAFNDSHSPVAPMLTMEKSVKALLGGGVRKNKAVRR
jgi:broad specificity phosphatase PhoE